MINYIEHSYYTIYFQHDFDDFSPIESARADDFVSAKALIISLKKRGFHIVSFSKRVIKDISIYD